MLERVGYDCGVTGKTYFGEIDIHANIAVIYLQTASLRLTT
jgi:hypothetical protein